MPALETLAAAAGLSPFHFHRLFRRVTGVTPKAYASAQRARRVQASLQRGESVTGAIYEAGFNSSGRFYEAADAMLGMRPSAYRAGGAGRADPPRDRAQCSLGLVLVAATERGICAIMLGEDAGRAAWPTCRPASRAPGCSRPSPSSRTGSSRSSPMSTRRTQALALPLDIQGTAFQRRVWEVLQTIPPGTTLTYGEVAARLGAPNAVRAVAGACAANKLAVAIPCHRVVGADGALTGYRWGLQRKRALLEREGATTR